MLAFIAACSLAGCNPPLEEPAQDGEFCNRLKIAGTGTVDVWYSVKDKTMALDYYSFLYGEGDFEMDSTTSTAEKAGRLQAPVNGTAVPLNLFDSSRMTFRGDTPLIGGKYIKSNSFYGGIGAEIMEYFEVTEMDREQSTFFASTNPATGMKDPAQIAAALGVSPVHGVGTETRTAFNGTWITDAKMHKFMEKDVKVHEAFQGRFEVVKQLKFHENPVAEQRSRACDGIDC